MPLASAATERACSAWSSSGGSFRSGVSDTELRNLVGYLRRFRDRSGDPTFDDFAKEFQELQSHFRELEKQRSRLGRDRVKSRREEAGD
jgi:hypothetical protein